MISGDHQEESFVQSGRMNLGVHPMRWLGVRLELGYVLLRVGLVLSKERSTTDVLSPVRLAFYGGRAVTRTLICN